MGNASSSGGSQQPQQQQQQGQPPISVGVLSQQRQPTYDGASGLNYSGRVYANQFAALSSNICPDASAVTLAEARDVMDRSISSPGLPIDDSTKRISMTALAGHVNNLEGQGLVPGLKGTMDEQTKADRDFYAAVQKEYCFYEVRYKVALTEFLTAVANPATVNDPNVQRLLDLSTGLNRRLNSLLEVLNYVGNNRARAVNNRSTQLEEASKALDEKVAILKAQKDYITSNDVRLRTQEEMIRYSAEKSTSMNVQIASFVALNVVAVGALFFVYKSLGAGGSM
uniref:Uncharacterized protein n=1 Tax=viral metagenome TaxID=1070528 RepID=A0A6C0DC50_9ZZZZ